MIVYGGGMRMPIAITHSNLPFVLAGGGGGTITPGRYVKFDSEPASNLS